jgi:hypothetical protein
LDFGFSESELLLTFLSLVLNIIRRSVAFSKVAAIQNLKSKIELFDGIKVELKHGVPVRRIISNNRDGFAMDAGVFARINFDFDFANLTRLQDFRKVHGCASSARGYGFNIQWRIAGILDVKRTRERFLKFDFAIIGVGNRKKKLRGFAGYGRIGCWRSWPIAVLRNHRNLAVGLDNL